MNEFNYADKIGTRKSNYNIEKNCLMNFNTNNIQDNSRSDIEMTARTQTYTIECKDRHYKKNFFD